MENVKLLAQPWIIVNPPAAIHQKVENMTMIVRRMRGIYQTAVPVMVRRSRIINMLKSYLLSHDFLYNSDYYAEIDGPAWRSAGPISKSILDDLKPRSLIDVGCGTGALLQALQNKGCEVFGLEYSEAALEYCRARRLKVAKFDLERDSFSEHRSFDVAVSLEVAEHLPKEVADRYVDLLTRLSQIVVFSAARPGQHGSDHVNMQPPSYWVSEFGNRGFQVVEELSHEWRTGWIATGEVSSWYCENLMIFKYQLNPGKQLKLQRQPCSAREPAILLESPSPWILPPGAPVVRIPSRPLDCRDASFDSLYDHDTIFYDCFWVQPNSQVLLIGPPLLNLQASMMGMRVRSIPSGNLCTFRIRQLDRHVQFWVDATAGTKSLAIEGTLGSASLPIQPNRTDLFSGKRVIVTLSKNNPLEWIRDWIRFHRDVHGANAVLLYDNASTNYTIEHLQQELMGLAGIDRLCIVRWPFKYGPQGYFRPSDLPLGTGRGRHWDSDYCQAGVLENARWRFLQTARSILNADVDELVVSRNQSIFELAESSHNKYVSFFGRWVVAPVIRGENLFLDTAVLRHYDFRYSLKTKKKWRIPRSITVGMCPTKWAIAPTLCPLKSQWRTHRVTGFIPRPLSFEQVSYRHFRELNTGWKYDRSTRDSFDASKHDLDTDLLASFSKVRWNA